MSSSDIRGIILVLGAALTMLLLLRLYRKVVNPQPEWLRKLAHIGTGLISSSFPWLFSSAAPALFVCASSIVLLLALRYLPPLRSQMAGVLDGVSRDSYGELYFPLSVAALYLLSHGNKILFVVPILVLTFADTIAALTGQQYGKHQYAAAGGSKSLEGSALFFTSTFLVVHIPLLLFTQVGRAQSLLIALDIALIVTLLEAVAWRGLDNIFIPMGVFALMKLYSEMPVSALVSRLVVATGLMVFVMVYRRRTTLEASALLAGALVLYASWALGGWHWLLPPSILLLTYSLFYPGKFDAERTHNVYAVISVSSTGFVWLFLAKVWHEPRYLFAYTLAYTIHLAILGWTLACIRLPQWYPRVLPAVCVVKAWLFMFVPYVASARASRPSLLEAALALPISGVAFWLFCWLQPRQEGLYSVESGRWYWQAGVAFVPTVLASFL